MVSPWFPSDSHIKMGAGAYMGKESSEAKLLSNPKAKALLETWLMMW